MVVGGGEGVGMEVVKAEVVKAAEMLEVMEAEVGMVEVTAGDSP